MEFSRSIKMQYMSWAAKKWQNRPGSKKPKAHPKPAKAAQEGLSARKNKLPKMGKTLKIKIINLPFYPYFCDSNFFTGGCPIFKRNLPVLVRTDATDPPV